jgi:hypothetical protein
MAVSVYCTDRTPYDKTASINVYCFVFLAGSHLALAICHFTCLVGHYGLCRAATAGHTPGRRASVLFSRTRSKYLQTRLPTVTAIASLATRNALEFQLQQPTTRKKSMLSTFYCTN